MRPLMKGGESLFRWVIGLRGGKMRIQGRPLVVLTTTGARTGKTRQTILARFDDPSEAGSYWVIGSNNGALHHPAWCFNLRKNPDRVWIETEGRKAKVVPDSLVGAERDQAWEQVVALAPGYGKYTAKTDRVIPIIRLTPEATST
jgi:deazaflavin-dependent oxidoreductase (nitroreductase family)